MKDRAWHYGLTGDGGQPCHTECEKIGKKEVDNKGPKSEGKYLFFFIYTVEKRKTLEAYKERSDMAKARSCKNLSRNFLDRCECGKIIFVQTKRFCSN